MVEFERGAGITAEIEVTYGLHRHVVDCSRGMALPDQLIGAPIESLSDLDAESGHEERTRVAANEPPIEPRRAVAFLERF
jgi:hypothetical protein